MSWHFSRALVAEYSAANSLDGELSVPWKSIPFAVDDLCSDKMKDTFHRSPFGTMFVPLTESLGGELLTWFRADFLVNHSALLHTDAPLLKTSGLKCDELLAKFSPPSCSLKTYLIRQLEKPLRTAKNLAIELKLLGYQRKTWVQTIFGNDIGYLHTPTCAMNYAAASMQKHPNCRIFVQVFGKPNPTNQEWLMGWPIGWTDSTPLEMDRFLSWQQRHGVSC